MSLLDDARQLLQVQPLEKDQDDDADYCRVCGEKIGGYPEWAGHSPDCGWLSMPKIVAALEAAELLLASARRDPSKILATVEG
jgi:hypothetical protein